MAQIQGMEQLRRQLGELKSTAQSAVMRNAAGFAMTPVATRLQQTAPKGSVEHKTYKGRTVAPGFMSRSVRKVTTMSKDRKTVWSMVGFSQEAFYALFFSTSNSRKQRKDDFQERALGDQVDTVTERFAEQMAKAIAKAASKK